MNTKKDFTKAIGSLSLDKGDILEYLENSYNEIHGFLWDEATLCTVLLSQIQRKLSIGGDVAEIGLWYGKYFFLLSLLCREGEKATGVDSFVHAADPVEHERQFRQFLQDSVSGNKHVSVLKEDSQTLTPRDLDPDNEKKIRIFSVDGDHTCAGALHDLKLAAETICQGGVIILDDYYNPTCPGVTEAYFRFDVMYREYNLRPFAYIANKLFITHDSHAQQYYDLFFTELKNNEDIPFGQQALDFHENHNNLGIPIQLSGADILIVLLNTWPQ